MEFFKLFQFFQTNPKIKLRKHRTRKIEKKYSRPDPGGSILYCKKLLHFIFQYKIPKMLMDHPDPAKRSAQCVQNLKLVQSLVLNLVQVIVLNLVLYCRVSKLRLFKLLLLLQEKFSRVNLKFQQTINYNKCTSCIGKSPTQNFLVPTDLTDNHYGKEKKGFESCKSKIGHGGCKRNPSS